MGEKTPAVRWPSRPRLSGGGGGWRLADSLGYVGLATWSAWCLPGVWSPSCVLWRPPSEAVALHGVGMSREPRGGGRQGGLQEGGFLWPLCFLSCAPGCVSCAAGTPCAAGTLPRWFSPRTAFRPGPWGAPSRSGPGVLPSLAPGSSCLPASAPESAGSPGSPVSFPGGRCVEARIGALGSLPVGLPAGGAVPCVSVTCNPYRVLTSFRSEPGSHHPPSMSSLLSFLLSFFLPEGGGG